MAPRDGCLRSWIKWPSGAGLAILHQPTYCQESEGWPDIMAYRGLPPHEFKHQSHCLSQMAALSWDQRKSEKRFRQLAAASIVTALFECLRHKQRALARRKLSIRQSQPFKNNWNNSINLRRLIMACYCNGSVRYRGRLFSISLRYCIPMCGEKWGVVRGKPLRLTRYDLVRLYQLLDKQRVGERCQADRG